MDEYNTTLPGAAYLDSRNIAPPPSPVIAPTPGPANAGPTAMQPEQQGPGAIPQLISQREKELGGRLDATELSKIGDYAKARLVMPALAAQKMDEWQAKSHLAGFDADFQKFTEQYLARPGANAQPGVVTGNSQLSESIAAIPAAGGDIVGGLASMLDYAMRYPRAAARGAAAIASGEKSWNDIASPDALMAAYGPKATFVGDAASAIGGFSQGIRDKYYTDSYHEAQSKISDAINNKDYAGIGKVIADHPMFAVTMAEEMAVGFGGAGQLTKIPKYARLVETLSQLPKIGKYTARVAQVLPSGLAYAGQQARQFEDGIRNSTVEELSSNPKVAGLLESAKFAGYSDAEALDKVKDKIIGEGLDNVLSTSLLANIGLPSAFGTAERAVATGGLNIGRAVAAAPKGFVKGAAHGLAHEAPEEALAGAIEQWGLNQGNQEQDTSKGVGGQAVLGGILGGLVGGSVGGITERKKSLKKAAPTPTATTGTNVPPAGTATPASTPSAPAAPTGPAFSDTPAENFDRLQPTVANSIKQNGLATKTAKAETTAAGLVVLAQNITQQSVDDTDVKWASLSLDQQNTLVEATAEALNESRGKKKLADLGTTLVQWKQNRAPAPAVAATPAPGEVPPVAPANTPPESTPDEVRAAIAAVGGQPVAPVAAPPVEPTAAPPAPVAAAPTPAQLALRTGIITRLTNEFGMTPNDANRLDLPQAQTELAARTKAAADKRAADIATADAKASGKDNTSTLTPEQKRKNYVQSYLQALVNQGPSTGPVEDEIRGDSNFNKARQELAKGLITSPETLDTFLTAQSRPAPTVSPSTSENVLLGVAIGTKGNGKQAKQNRELGRVLIAELQKRGISNEEAKGMTFAQGKETITRLDALKTPPKPLRATTTVKKDVPVPAKPKSEGPKPLSKTKAAATPAVDTSATSTAAVEAAQEQSGTLEERITKLESDVGKTEKARDVAVSKKAPTDTVENLNAKVERDRATLRALRNEKAQVDLTASLPVEGEQIVLPDSKTKGTFKAAAKSADVELSTAVKLISKHLLANGLATTGQMNSGFTSFAKMLKLYNDSVGKTPSPKTQAPAQTKPAGAADSKKTQSPQPSPQKSPLNQPSADDALGVETRVSSILDGSDANADDINAIAKAIAGNELNDLMKVVGKLSKDGDITNEQSKAIFALHLEAQKVAKAAKKAGGLVEDKTTLVVTPDEDVSGLADLDAIATRSETTNGLVDLVPNSAQAVQVRSEIRKWFSNLKSGKWSVERAAAAIEDTYWKLVDRGDNKNLRRALTDRVRGADWFEERLARALRMGEVPAETIEFMRWLIRKNPNIVKLAALSIKQLNKNADGLQQAGFYNSAARIISLATDAVVGINTGVHEILHHAERLMSRDVQEGIRREYTRNLLSAYKSATDSDVKAYLEAVINGESEATVLPLYAKARTKQTNIYQYMNPSEYWAVNGPMILSARQKADNGSWVAKAAQWTNEFVSKIKAIFGAQSNAAIIKALNSVLKSDGDFISKKMLFEEGKLFSDITEADKSTIRERLQDSTAPFINRVWETLGEKTIAFQHEVARIINAGGKVTPENNPVLAVIRFNGIKNDNLSLDESEVGSHVYNWFTENYQSFGADREDALRNINKFLHNTHVLERNHWLWLTNAKLGAGMAYNREVVLEKFKKGDLSPDEARTQLERLAAQHALENEIQYGKKHIDDYDALVSALVDLKKGSDTQNPIDKNSMGDLNTLLQNVRDRARQRNLDSGFLSENDKWAELYNFKWYVPLTGTRSSDSNSQIADLEDSGVMSRVSLARINKQIEVMKGRKSISDSPLEKLLVSMASASQRSATNSFVESVYRFVLDNRKLIPGLVINVYKGIPKDGFEQTSGEYKKSKKDPKKNRTFFRKIPASDTAIIYHDGDTHYQIVFPKDSLMLRGILQMNNESDLLTHEKIIGKGTNILSRLYTTINPIWQTFVALPRDLTYMPTMLAITEEENPIAGVALMGKYIANLASNTFSPGNLAAAWDILTNDSKTIAEYAAANPTSTVAWLRLYEKSGGSTHFSAGYNSDTLGNRLTGKYNNAEGIWQVTKPWRVYEKFTTDYAGMLENIGRVAAFRTLVESGQSPEEAAAKVKGYLNYDQSGTHSRRVNSYIQFFKVGMTGADAIRKAFTKANGQFDVERLASYSLLFALVGAAKYLLDKELYGKDDKGEDIIKQFKLDTLTQKALIKVGDKTFGFNIGLGLPQILTAPGTIMGAMIAGHVTPAEAGRAYYEMIGRNAPVRPSGLPKEWGWPDLVKAWTVGSLVPSPLVGVASVADNKDAFGRPIHTAYPDADLFKSDQAKGSTPDDWSQKATWLREHLGIDMYPEDMRFMTKSYGGQLVSAYLKLTSEYDSQEEAGAKPASVAGNVSGLVVNDQDFYLRNETYDTLDKLAGAGKRLKSAIKVGERQGIDKAAAERQFLATTPGVGVQVAAHKALDKAITDYNARVKLIRANKISGQGWKDAERKKADSVLREAYLKAKTALPE